MAKDSNIAWTDHSFNGWWGCQRVSPGCEHCYAEAFDKRTGRNDWGPKAPRRFFGDKHWAEPLKWDRAAAAAGERHRVFCSSMSDVFEDRSDLDPHRHRLWKLIESTPNLDWMLLTKRPENNDLVPLAWQTGSRRPPNVWLGTTTEDQTWADRRVPYLLESAWPAQRFISYEPALGAVIMAKEWLSYAPARIDWVIAGGESGPGRRPCEVEWFENIRQQCDDAGVAFFMKQDSGLYPGRQGRLSDELFSIRRHPA